MTTMIAFHGKAALKKERLARVAQHRKLDNLVKGATGSGGKGCAVWCTMNVYSHSAYESELGIPHVLARLEDIIFERLPDELSQKWPERFLKAIKPGADLSLVWPQFALWMLGDPVYGVLQYAKREDTKKAIQRVIDLYGRKVNKDEPTCQEWSAAARWSAAAARWSAAAARWSAAAAARWIAFSDKLIELLKACK